MPNFDPIDLGTYMPSGMVPIREVANSILSAFIKAQYASMSDNLSREDLSDDERCFIKKRLEKNSHLYDAYELQQWSWSIVRDKLVTEELQAFAIDEKRNLHPLRRDFWISEYGNVALSTGIILPIPLFEPRGEVIVLGEESFAIYRSYFDSVYNGYKFAAENVSTSLIESSPVLLATSISDNVERRGAKAKFDIELFLHEAFALIYDANPMPKTQAELGRRAAEAYEVKSGKGGRPSDPWVRATVAKLWHRLDLGQE